MPGLAALWWGGESPRATLLPPRRLRAALHLVRRHQKHRCARLEPRSAFSRMRLAQLPEPALLTSYPTRPLFPSMPGLVHMLSSPLSLADYERSRPTGPRQARATTSSPRRSFGVDGTSLYCVFVHVIARGALLCPASVRCGTSADHTLIWQLPSRGGRLGAAASVRRESRRESRALRRPQSWWPGVGWGGGGCCGFVVVAGQLMAGNYQGHQHCVSTR